MLKLIFAIWLGKFISFLTQTFKIGGGSAAPGYYALKFCPDLVSKLAPQIPQNVIITGTNGKTTTARLLAHFMKDQKTKVLRNSTGSNLERGVASHLIRQANIFGKITNTGIGIWELDEAAFNSLAPKIKPQMVVFLNLFRDQLDRYGEIDSVRKKWEQSLKKLSSDSLLILNGDDANIASLSKYFSGRIQTFGLSSQVITGESTKNTTGKGDFLVTSIKENGLVGSEVNLKFNSHDLDINLPLPGIYHIYDFLAAFAAGYNLNLDTVKMIDSLKNYVPAFGRMEKIQINGKNAYIFLIKNPVGATQVFKTIAPNFQKNDKLLLALNDNFADGKDVSWIWDAEFEKLPGNRHQAPVLVSGTRAQDMAVRLKYAGFSPELITIDNSLIGAFRQAKKGLEGSLYIMPTYTALLELQKILTKEGIKQHYWKDEI